MAMRVRQLHVSAFLTGMVSNARNADMKRYPMQGYWRVLEPRAPRIREQSVNIDKSFSKEKTTS